MSDAAINKENLPNHVACVMDGNGRWAAARGLNRTDGHTAGEEALSRVARTAHDLGINNLTVYAFSTENWRRPKAEVTFLMRLFNEQLLLKRREELHENNVKVRFIGRPSWRIPKKLAARIEETEALTADNTGMCFRVAFNYGSQAEIVDAAKRLVADGVDPEDVNEKELAARFYDPSMPQVDLWIRTSGEYRVSNFLIWQAAYAEMVFLDTFWPDMDEATFAGAIVTFQNRERRFGGLGN